MSKRCILIAFVIILVPNMTSSDSLFDPTWDWDYRLTEDFECVEDCCENWETASYEFVPVWVIDELAVCIHPDEIQWRFHSEDYRNRSGVCDEDFLQIHGAEILSTPTYH